MNITFDELATEHMKVEQAEKNVQMVDNFLKYYKGVIYYIARGKYEGRFMTWIREDIKCTKSTIYRYISFAAFILRFPKLIICDLNFSQILKHKQRIML